MSRKRWVSDTEVPRTSGVTTPNRFRFEHDSYIKGQFLVRELYRRRRWMADEKGWSRERILAAAEYTSRARRRTVAAMGLGIRSRKSKAGTGRDLDSFAL